MKPRHKRLAIIAGALASLGVAAALVLNALDSNIALYVTPSEVAAGKAPQGKAFRIGGMVKEGSIQRKELTVHFVITDTARDIPVAYTGILPDLFKEGKGAVIQGRLGTDGLFTASEVLAKHDENYMPPAAEHAVEQAQRAQKSLKP
ncbi:MAG: cytochrome c maturation protein CcmE [Burkholderiales bacterium]|jgi:cytochrome c-type biogenesis protein CcmE|nr:cytochrome c maturation protein CcmE [Burkholderiales bacterium]MBP7519428.1 cytochrome c maturation protein CcmE [Leptothrix sp. (in: b-proteobacteria)]HQY09670.1 cytochrome c maturation protein CcmE [Burkholderiaceae bacterium]